MGLFNKLDFFIKRVGEENAVEYADKCIFGLITLPHGYVVDIKDGNIFEDEMEGDNLGIKREYLLSMDYVSRVILAYRSTGNEEYKFFFEKIIGQYCDYCKERDPLDMGVAPELPIYGQVLMLVLAVNTFGENIPRLKELYDVFIKYSSWLTDKKNRISDNNHGVFQVLSLLHLSQLLGIKSDLKSEWEKYALDHLELLYRNAYYKDGSNNEHSIAYFKYNNTLYESVLEFCKYYKLQDLKKVLVNLEKPKKVLVSIADSDNKLPQIGDGKEVWASDYNNESVVLDELGLAVIKNKNVYLTYKVKTTSQSHAHIDLSSITLRYKNQDIVLDSGKYNFDKFTPINRYVRSSQGHSGFFPCYLDGFFMKDLIEKLELQKIFCYEKKELYELIEGGYSFDGIQTRRRIIVNGRSVKVIDSFNSDRSVMMRQRFVLPEEAINGQLIMSKKLFEFRKKDFSVSFEVESDEISSYTVANFGVYSTEYGVYRNSLLLDTYMYAKSGTISTTVRINELQNIEGENVI